MIVIFFNYESNKQMLWTDFVWFNILLLGFEEVQKNPQCSASTLRLAMSVSWFRLKYRTNYWMDFHEILHRRSWFPEDESH